MHLFIIVNGNVWDNKSLGDEYVRVLREVFFRFREEGWLNDANYKHHINHVIHMGKKTRNTARKNGIGAFGKNIFVPLDLVKHFRKHGKMPYGIDLAYARNHPFPKEALNELGVIISNTREQAINIIDGEYRKALGIPPRTI